MNTHIYPSPYVPLYLAVDDQGRLARLGFVTEKHPLESHVRAEDRPNAAACAKVVEQLDAYFAGQRTQFDLELAPEGTPFQREVWDALLEIPFGETRNYGQIAKQVGRPNASRAVGAANGANPIAIVVPCHRVIGADGSLTGFGGGVHVKSRLLELEQGSLF